MLPKTKTPKPACLLVTGSILVTLGMILLFMWPWIINYLLNSIKTLRPNGMVYNLWKKNPMPLSLEVYMFNWTNPEDIKKPNVKPRFEEIGPFVFKETKEKVNITWNNNDTVTFRQLRHWYFDEKRSVANLSTQIVTINSIAVTAAYVIRDWNFIMKKGFSISLHGVSPHIYVKKSVGELLFEGYSDPLINLGKAMPLLASTVKMPDLDKFGWFYTRNGSHNFDGTFNMEAGGQSFGSLKNWNYVNRTSFFTDECNKVHGSAGELYPSYLKRNQISFFSADICRNVPLDYSEDVEVDGITGYKFAIGESFLDNGTKIPGNKCFCTGDCVPSGALNVSTCKFGSPGFVSLPHFYGADPYYLNTLEGLKPKKDRHEMFMILEPTTGVPLQVAARLQLSVLVQPIKYISMFENVPKIFLPVLWFEQVVDIPKDIGFLLKLLICMPTIFKCVAGIMILLSMPCLFIVIYGPLIEKMHRKVLHEKICCEDSSIGKPTESEIALLARKLSSDIRL